MTEEIKVFATMIIEVLGKPAEHLKETLQDMIKKIGAEKGVMVKSSIINEPRFLQDSKEFYTNFAEIEVEVDSPFVLSLLMFKYMPAHIDVVTPEKMIMRNTDLNEMMNEIIMRLHKYDELARIFQMQKKVLENKIKELSKDLNELKKEE